MNSNILVNLLIKSYTKGGEVLDFHVGYDTRLYVALMKAAHFISRCESCKYYDENDICQNSFVTPFDMVTEEGRTFCCFWKPEDVKDETEEVK